MRPRPPSAAEQKRQARGQRDRRGSGSRSGAGLAVTDDDAVGFGGDDAAVDQRVDHEIMRARLETGEGHVEIEGARLLAVERAQDRIRDRHADAGQVAERRERDALYSAKVASTASLIRSAMPAPELDSVKTAPPVAAAMRLAWPEAAHILNRFITLPKEKSFYLQYFIHINMQPVVVLY